MQHRPAGPPQLFRSFWIAGFEGACHINSVGQRLDMLSATQHDIQVNEDYALLKSVGIRTARDGMRWPLIECGGSWDFSSLAPMVAAAQRHGIQVIWTICHYGWPDDLDVLSPAFVDRFARFCGKVARFIADHTSEVPFYSPLNEISFLAWAIGHAGIIYPYAKGRDHELKRQFIRAAIAGSEAIWSVDRRARFVHGDPIIHVIAPRGRPELADAAAGQRAAQFHAWDMLSGRMEPELGGHPKYLDIIGVHYYHANQWEHPDIRLRWEDTPRDERWLPLHKQLAEVHDRYRCAIFMGETSHFGIGRAPWIREIADEVALARENGVPVEGICLFPILDRHDWEDPEHWHNSGLWDLERDTSGKLVRILNKEYAEELERAQRLFARKTSEPHIQCA